MKRRICVVTATRAEYGLLRWVMEDLRRSPDLELQVVATGTHLSPEFGLTFRQIEKDGFRIDQKVETLLSADTPSGIAKSMGIGLIGFADALRDLSPDLIMVLGDRFELIPIVSSAIIAGIPVVHAHGGEITEGAFDECIRHAVTKMSHLHFVSTEEHRRRVIQLGEDPDRVFQVGALGLDALDRLDLLSRHELEKALEFQMGPRNLLVTFHPATLDSADPVQQLEELLGALAELADTHFIFTMPNADTGSRALMGALSDFVSGRKNACLHRSLGQLLYLSAMKHVDGVVGNSSSGLIEAPSLGTGTVNVGMRQKGRVRAESVIDCDMHRDAIGAALGRLLSSEFQEGLGRIRNPYGSGGASRKIVEVLEAVSLDGLVRKKFFDLPGLDAMIVEES